MVKAPNEISKRGMKGNKNFDTYSRSDILEYTEFYLAASAVILVGLRELINEIANSTVSNHSLVTLQS